MKPPPALLLLLLLRRNRRCRAALVGAGIVFFSLSHAGSAVGQHIYVDANGDGVHSALDLLNPTGATTFDVWLRTDTNADGSAAVCPTGELTVSSYELILHASRGTVAWGAVTNRITDFLVSSGSASNETDLYFGFSGALHPPGIYRLATVEVSIQSGAPSIHFAPTTSLGGYLTSFVSRCSGYDGDYTLKLGLDWSDAEGLPFPVPNEGPALSPPQDVTLREGEIVEQTLRATDGDGEALTFSKGSGPRYLSVETTDPGTGTAAGTLRVAPDFGSAGAATGVILVDDGIVTDSKRISITVADVTQPTLLPLPDMTLPGYTVATQAISALNPDGVPLEFTKSAGPDFLSVRSTGLSTAKVAVEPGLQDEGSSVGEITVSDGVSRDTESFGITVTPLPPCGLGLCVSSRLFPIEGDPRGLAIGDMNADGVPDVIVTSFLRGFITEFLGRGNGSFYERVDIPVGDGAGWPYIADLNGDGSLDVVVTTLDAFPNVHYRLTVLLGAADGTLRPYAFYRLRSFTDRPLWPDPLRIGDVNGDGIPDLVMLVSAVRPIALLLGFGDGTFYLGGEVELGFEGRGLALGDLNGDSILDIVVGRTNLPPAQTAVVRLGQGGGVFGPPAEYEVNVVPGSLALADLNRDGISDLVVANTRLDGGVSISLGVGDGSFGPPRRFDSRSSTLFTVSDLSGDGKMDLALFGYGPPHVVTLLLGGGDGSFGESHEVEVEVEGTVSDITAGDLDRDGREDLILSLFPPRGGMTVMLNRGFKPLAPPPPLPARAFVMGGPRTIPLVDAGPSICVQIQPENGAYRNDEVAPSSFVMRADGLGSVDSIAATSVKSILGDRDRDGVNEIAACFSRADLRNLLAGVRGRATVEVALEGRLLNGSRIRAPLTLTVVSTGGRKRTGMVSPDSLTPAFSVTLLQGRLNDQPTIAVTTTKDGFLRAKIFDVQGRLVAEPANEPLVGRGPHAYSVGQRTGRMASGLYFYLVETPEKIVRGRFVIVR